MAVSRGLQPLFDLGAVCPILSNQLRRHNPLHASSNQDVDLYLRRVHGFTMPGRPCTSLRWSFRAERNLPNSPKSRDRTPPDSTTSPESWSSEAAFET